MARPKAVKVITGAPTAEPWERVCVGPSCVVCISTGSAVASIGPLAGLFTSTDPDATVGLVSATALLSLLATMSTTGKEPTGKGVGLAAAGVTTDSAGVDGLGGGVGAGAEAATTTVPTMMLG